MHENNCFITLTYDDEHLKSPWLQYDDFRNFMKKLRKLQDLPIGFMCAGEYGEERKRPHWHAIIFNWSPKDGKYKYSNERGDKVYESATLTKVWRKGMADYGSVTIESAGYCARYAAKKLVHGWDDDHPYQPISKKSNKNAIGKKWIEKFWPDVFSYGKLILKDGTQVPIPRYYEKWFKENHPEAYAYYLEHVKSRNIEKAEAKTKRALEHWQRNVLERKFSATIPLTPNQVRKKIQEKRFKEQLQVYLKL